MATTKTTVLWVPEALAWYNGLNAEQLAAVNYSVALLVEHGALLGMPHAKKVVDAAEAIIELRPSSRKYAMRVFYAFDPRRQAIMLVGADKKGVADEGPWTNKMAARAARSWDTYLRLNGWRR